MKKILIVRANYYNKISDNLTRTSINFFKKNKIKISEMEVPGIFEIPIAIRKNINNFDGFIPLFYFDQTSSVLLQPCEISFSHISLASSNLNSSLL